MEKVQNRNLLDVDMAALFRNNDSQDAIAKHEEGNVDTSQAAADKKSDWQHFSVICSVEIVRKIKALSEKEGFKIREIVEKMLNDGLTAYENKHGPLTPASRKIEDLY